jgi:hypothetical protein
MKGAGWLGSWVAGWLGSWETPFDSFIALKVPLLTHHSFINVMCITSGEGFRVRPYLHPTDVLGSLLKIQIAKKHHCYCILIFCIEHQ